MNKGFLILFTFIMIPQMASAVETSRHQAAKKNAKTQSAMESLIEEAKNSLPGEPCKTPIAKCGDDLACMYWTSVAQETCAKR